MPHTTYGVLKAIRSHEVSSPSLADDLSAGRPNACNLCHLDKTLAWTGDYLRRWYTHEIPPLPQNAANTSHALQLAIRGDAGQRALIAWHLGWQPALEASGRGWVPPVLGQLLDDPYAAVRLVAERSLQVFPEFIPPRYDYTIEPDKRPPVREQVWEKWLNSRGENGSTNQAVLEHARTLEELREVYANMLSWRDHRSIRLRE